MGSKALQTTILLLAIVPVTVACESMPLELHHVASNLTVLVTHRGEPIAGIDVLVVREKIGEPIFQGTTGSHGTIRIKHLAPGRYHLIVSHDEFEAGKELIEVDAAPVAKPEKELKFKWADWSYETTHVAGTLTGLVPGNTGNALMDIVHPVETVYPGVDVTLRAAFGKEEYFTISDSAGTFSFGDVPGGIYILTVAGGMNSISGTADTTKQIIEVKQTALRASLPLQLKDSGCYRTEFILSEK